MSDEKCVYDYANKCDCSEDDKCGCTFPNNIPHDFQCEPLQPQSAATPDTALTAAKSEYDLTSKGGK